MAVKVVDLSQSNEAVTPERVRREVIATARLNHPNIVTIFDAGTDADLAFLVMELLPGRSLAQLVRAEGVLDVERVVDIALQVSRALDIPLPRAPKLLETMHYITEYEQEAAHDGMVLELARLDFELVRSLYLKELKALSL